jgi:uncharacterized damage-inducible protein DinB
MPRRNVFAALCGAGRHCAPGARWCTISGMSLRAHFVQMARNNAWSNLRLHAACRKLDASALTAPRTSFFPSILRTLRHLWIVDEYYVDGLERGGRGASVWADEDRHPTLELLWAAQRSVDRRLVTLCEHVQADADLESSVALERKDGVHTDRMADVLAHLFVHQIHHRGQVHAMLSGTHVSPPQLDEWFLAEDRARAERELAEGL